MKKELQEEPFPLQLVSIFLELPFAIIQRAHLASFEPARNAMKMEGVLKFKRKISIEV